MKKPHIVIFKQCGVYVALGKAEFTAYQIAQLIGQLVQLPEGKSPVTLYIDQRRPIRETKGCLSQQPAHID
jgi:hypothetical protein